MKKTSVIIVLFPLLLNSCGTNKIPQIDKEEKFNILIENNKNLTDVSIVGEKSAKMIEEARARAEKRQRKFVKEKLNNIQGINIIENNDSNSIIANIQDDVLFEFDKAEIKAETRAILNHFSNVLVQNIDTTNLLLDVVGYTDNVGNYEYNKALSKSRAVAVSNVLIKNGIRRENIRTMGKGIDNPVASNDTPSGRSKNRRVEIIIKK